MRLSPAAACQQARELAFGRLQRRVRHVVDEADREHRVGGLAARTESIGLAQLRRR